MVKTFSSATNKKKLAIFSFINQHFAFLNSALFFFIFLNFAAASPRWRRPRWLKPALIYVFVSYDTRREDWTDSSCCSRSRHQAGAMKRKKRKWRRTQDEEEEWLLCCVEVNVRRSTFQSNSMFTSALAENKEQTSGFALKLLQHNETQAWSHAGRMVHS